MKPMPDPLPRPDASEYEEFQDYEHVRTVGDDQDSDKVNVDNELTLNYKCLLSSIVFLR